MKPHVNIAVVGASWFTDLWYMPVLQKHPNVNIMAICSKSGHSAGRLAERYHVPKVYTNYREMFDADGEVDCVCIVTPNDSHKDIALAAIEKKLHVICEKPIALDSSEAEQMVKAAVEKNVVHAINFTYREHPAILKMRALVHESLIGKVHEARFEYSGDYGLNGPPGWRGTIAQGGIGGILQDLGSHLIDIAELALAQRIVKVQGRVKFYENGLLKEKGAPGRAADSVRFFAEFDGGTEASFLTSWVAPQGSKRQTIGIQLHGSKGSMNLLTCELGTSLQYAKNGRKWETVNLRGLFPLDFSSEPSEEKFRPWRLTEKNEVWKWVDNIIGVKGVELASFETGCHVQKVIDAIIESAKRKEPISI